MGFCEEFGTKGIVVTKDVMKEGIVFVPAWVFLLVVG